MLNFDLATSVEIEEHILASVLLDGSNFEQLRGIDPDCFTSEHRRLILASMTRVDKDGFPPEYMTVVDDIHAHAASSPELTIYMSGIVDGSRGVSISTGRKILQVRLATRILHGKLGKYLEAMDKGAQVSVVAAGLLRAAQEAIPAHGGVCGVNEVYEDLERHQLGDAPAYLTFGFQSLDEFGPSRDELVIIGARPSIGKTSLAINLADRLSRRGEISLFLSLESSAKAIQIRRLSLLSGVSVRDLKTKGTISEGGWVSIQRHMNMMKKNPIHVVDGVFNIMELCTEIRAAKIEHNITAVFVDHIGRVRLPGRREHRHELGQVTAELAALAKDIGVCVFALAQLNRAAESREDKRPTQADLRDSGELEQDADHIWMLHRPGRYFEDAGDDFEIIVAKQRDGELGSAMLKFNGKTCSVYE